MATIELKRDSSALAAIKYEIIRRKNNDYVWTTAKGVKKDIKTLTDKELEAIVKLITPKDTTDNDDVIADVIGYGVGKVI